MTTMTVRLTEKEAQDLKNICELAGKSRSEVVRDALRASFLRERLKTLRDELQPKAREIGWLTEEDVFRDVS
jgi:metal-responsive CopG/Arc/MetJ family transcriptional regulator